MASSLSTTSSSSSVSAMAKTTTSHFHHSSDSRLSRVSFRLYSMPKLRFLPKPGLNSNAVVKARWSTSAPYPAKLEVAAIEAQDSNLPEEPSSPAALATEGSISEFIKQVSTLVKLVDSRDIAELHLKQLDCELVIRKREALPQPQSLAPVVMMQPPSQPSFTPPAPTPAPAPASSPAPSSPASSPPPPPSSPKSSLPTLKCPMAGTFYRSPAPGEPPLVKVGDKVKKGQILCIIEAMKLMNEIEADQSGTIVDILVEDGKPVSVDAPLFVIQP